MKNAEEVQRELRDCFSPENSLGILENWKKEICKECAKAGKNWLREYFSFENKDGLSNGEALLAIEKAIDVGK